MKTVSKPRHSMGRKLFFLVISLGIVLVSAVTVTSMMFAGQSIRRQLLLEMNNQTVQIRNYLDQKLVLLNTVVQSATQQSSFTLLMSNQKSSYQNFSASRNCYEYMKSIHRMDANVHTYAFIPWSDYVLSSDPAEISSDFHIEESPCADWYGVFRDSYIYSFYDTDFVTPVKGRSGYIAYITALRRTASWEIKGLIAATFDLSAMNELVSDTQFTQTGFLVLMDADDKLIFSSNPALSEPVADQLPQTRLQAGQDRWTRLGRYQAIALPVSYGDLTLLACIDGSELNEQLLKNQTALLIMAASCLIVLFLVAWYISKTISSPIRRLNDFVHQVGNTDLDRHVELNVGNEVGELADSFNRMIDDVRLNQVLKRRAEIDALQKQINPHFLYNTLESIKALAIRYETRNVCETIDHLGDMFRYNIDRDPSPTTTVQKELMHIEDYLFIEQIRYGKRLEYTLDVPEEIKNITVLKFILQPLVENSIRHGMENAAHPLNIRISASMDGGSLLFEVRDNGSGIPSERLETLQKMFREDSGGKGIGLWNTHQRLRMYYGGESGISIDSAPGEGTRVTMRLDLETKGDDAV